MKTLATLGLTCVFGITAAPAGIINGVVHAQGPDEPATADAGGAYASHRYKFAEKIDYAHLTDFVVYIDQPLAELKPRAPIALAVTTQKDASFEPHVLPVAVGTTVRWPNEDDIYHNVYSTSDAKEFDLNFYKKDRVPEVVFDKPGRVDVFCAIHTQMHCIILVLPNPFFAKADGKGRFAIRDVPPGTYKLRAWHERLPGQVKEIVVPAEGDVTVDFTLGVTGLPKY